MAQIPTTNDVYILFLADMQRLYQITPVPCWAAFSYFIEWVNLTDSETNTRWEAMLNGTIAVADVKIAEIPEEAAKQEAALTQVKVEAQILIDTTVDPIV